VKGKECLNAMLVGKLVVLHRALTPIFADPNNWAWVSDSRLEWQPAREDWQAFRKKHYGRDDSVLNKKNPEGPVEVLSLEDMPPITHNVRSILVRGAHRPMFNYVWTQGLKSYGELGTLISGQPGTGADLLSLCFVMTNKCLFLRQDALPNLPPYPPPSKETSRAVHAGWFFLPSLLP
jgi:hypothetical protein